MSVQERLTVRDMVRAIQVEMAKGDMTPERADELLQQSTALIGNCNDEVRLTELAYNIVEHESLNSDEAANRARIRAKTTPQYRLKREAEDCLDLVLNMVRSLRRTVDRHIAEVNHFR
jgi:hypothetical protein